MQGSNGHDSDFIFFNISPLAFPEKLWFSPGKSFLTVSFTGYILSAELRYVLSRMDDEIAADEDLRDMFLETKLHVNRKITFNGEF